jgi:hypothetical protein
MIFALSIIGSARGQSARNCGWHVFWERRSGGVRDHGRHTAFVHVRDVHRLDRIVNASHCHHPTLRPMLNKSLQRLLWADETADANRS